MLKEYTFTPKNLEGTEYSGTVTVKIPHAKEKAGFLKKLKYTLDENGQVVPNKDLSEMLIGMIEITEEMILKCDIKKGEELISKEDLFYIDDLSLVIQEIGQLIVSGFKPSKN